MTEAIDICERAADALRGAGMDALGTRIDRITGKDGVVVRMMPSRTLEHYLDGSRLVECVLQVVSKRLNPADAMADCERASDALRAADLSSANGSYAVVLPAEPDGDMEELAVGEDRRHVWAVRLAVQIMRS
ncbi:MAG TPA: hypothetical protein IAC12_03820 [Candidatus Aphodovivens avistercoris]|nr:hypothetical protein [Candidatus Aphodovivens avistercoris]